MSSDSLFFVSRPELPRLQLQPSSPSSSLAHGLSISRGRAHSRRRDHPSPRPDAIDVRSHVHDLSISRAILLQVVLSGARVSSSSSFAVVGISLAVVRVETKLSISSNGDFFIIFKTSPCPFDSLQNGPSLWNVQKCPRESNPKFPMCDLAQSNITNLQPWSLGSC